MRLSKAITIDDDRITVFEVIVEDLLSVIDASEADVRNRIDELLPKCTDLSMARMKKMAPSELKKVWDAFREVNAVFFSAVEKTGMLSTLTDGMKNIITAEMKRNLAETISSGVSAG